MTTVEIISKAADLLWMGGLAATPLAIVVGAVCRWRAIRPATRHMLWFAVLASFVTPVLGALLWTPQWFRSDRVIAAADTVLPPLSTAKAEPKKAVEPPNATPSPRLSIRAQPAAVPEIRSGLDQTRDQPRAESRMVIAEPARSAAWTSDGAVLGENGTGFPASVRGRGVIALEHGDERADGSVPFFGEQSIHRRTHAA